LLETEQLWHLFDERQFAFCCSSVFYCSDGTSQEYLLAIIFEASNSEIRNLISSDWNTGLDNNV
jgi:hypothetical protein